MRGVDYSWGRPDLGQLVAEGYGFVCRYLSWREKGKGKNLTADERHDIHAHGLDIVLNWEYDSRGALGGYGDGQVHAVEALRQATELGAPVDTVIYFSVDFDAQPNDLVSVRAYFEGIAAVLPLHRIGVYGGLRAVGNLLDHNLVSHAWQTYAWSHEVWDPRAGMHQYLNGQEIAGAECDLNKSLSDHFGQWRAGGDVSFTDQDRANLQATDTRIREILLKGSDVYDDVPGEGPGQRPYLVETLTSIDDKTGDIRSLIIAGIPATLTQADRLAIATLVVSELVHGDAAAGYARLVANSVLDAMSARLGQ